MVSEVFCSLNDTNCAYRIKSYAYHLTSQNVTTFQREFEMKLLHDSNLDLMMNSCAANFRLTENKRVERLM